ncbi:MAG: alpha/beta fold hydrolase [Bacteroidetes bacterium]|jgi:dienelactone hydrolase|nr:alpha/beta fold hydrolase [Bacteroidota bacterium]
MPFVCGTRSTHSAYLAALLLVLALSGSAIATAQEGPLDPATDEQREAVSQFFGYNHEAPLRADVVAETETDAYTREKIVFTGVANSRVPAYLAMPTTEADAYPVVILIDGIYGAKERWFEDDSWPRGRAVTDRLIAEGFAVMALDVRYHGERAAENDYRISTHWADLRDMIVPSVREHRRAMDYLETREAIDTDRIGLLGLSMGGMMSFMLSAVEPRVQAVATGVTPAGAFPELRDMPIAPQTYAGGITDIPFLMMMGREDPYYTEAEATALFDLLPTPTKELIFYDAAHRLPDAYPGDAVSWLTTHLGE